MAAVKGSASDFALLGGKRTFATNVPVGQLYFPSWERYEDAMRAIFEREYYTNHGPLVQELEARLEDVLGTRHVLTVTNATVGLYLVAQALGLQGKVMVPAFTFIATAEAMSWAGLDVALCDVELDTHQISPLTADRTYDDAIAAVVGVNLWGGTCDPTALEAWARERGCEIFFDSAQAFGCATEEGTVGRFGRAEVFSFHATKIVSATEGGCITTDDDDLAERIRNMRSNYGIREARPVPLIINARMSEAQAAVALLSLDGFDEIRAHNERLARVYRDCLAALPGFNVIDPAAVVTTNGQYLVCEVSDDEFGLSRDAVLTILKSEGVAARRYCFPGIHRSLPYSSTHPQYRDSLPNTDAICAKVLQLPLGARVTVDDAARIAELVRDAHAHAPALRSALRNRVGASVLTGRRQAV